MFSEDLKIHQNTNNHSNEMPKQKVHMNKIVECEKMKRKNVSQSDDNLKVFKCRECTKMIASVHALTEHLRTIHNYKENQCHLCGYDYKTSGRLKVG